MNNNTTNNSSPTTDSARKDLHKYLCFLLGDKTYGISILRVEEIIEYTEIIPIPKMPDFICGAINLRGHVVPVVDIACRLSMERTTISKRTCIIVVEICIGNEAIEVGMLVDAVSQVANIPPGSIDPPPSFGGNLDTAFMQGMGKVNDCFVILLNVDCVLSLTDINMLSQVQTEETPADIAQSQNELPL